jgi:CheY-like chemotaxis protein
MEQQTLEPDDLCEGTETVLLVEDEESLRTLTRDALLESNYTILEASDGLEALEIARQHKGPIHLLLTDVVMPRMSGPALAKQLALQNPEVKVLFMSGYTGNTYKNESVEAASILRKPFTRRDLNQKVREVLENRSKSPVTEI